LAYRWQELIYFLFQNPFTSKQIIMNSSLSSSTARHTHLIVSPLWLFLILLNACSLGHQSQAELDRQLWNAIKYAQAEEVAQLLEKGANPHAEGQVKGQTHIRLSSTALISACEYALAEGSNSDSEAIRSKYEMLIKHGATMGGYQEIRLLLENAKRGTP